MTAYNLIKEAYLMDRYTIIELAEQAESLGINLGANPHRTIRYYISIGLLHKPDVVQEGKKRVSYYNQDHLNQLKIIDYLKKKKYSLKEIKKQLHKKVFLSEDGLKFIEKYRDEIPEGAFLKGMPVNIAEVAFFMLKFLEDFKKDLVTPESLEKFFIDEDGKPVEVLSIHRKYPS